MNVAAPKVPFMDRFVMCGDAAQRGFSDGWALPISWARLQQNRDL
jgi:hypothetical protein